MRESKASPSVCEAPPCSTMKPRRGFFAQAPVRVKAKRRRKMQCFMLMHLERVTNGKIRVEYVVGIFDEFVYM